jgi:hypothetical protein
MKHSFFQQIFAMIITVVILIGAGVEFYHVAWGTGKAVGEFSPRWLVLFILFVLFCLALFAGVVIATFHAQFPARLQRIVLFRNASALIRIVLAALVLILPIWFLQRTMWGIVFDGLYFRFLLWALMALLLSVLLTSGNELIGWKPFLASLVLTSSAFTIAISLQGVTDYPFSMGWSEGNRIWDYSILFGRSRYDFPDNQDIYVLLDSGRMLVGGLLFLIPDVGIEAVRFWIGLTLIIPYFLVGLAAHLVANKNARIWLLMTLWVFLFLRQGPIHPPLVLAAALTVFLWRKPLLLAIPLIIYAGFFAASSRFTWMFAPGIWIGMLELAGASLRDGKLVRHHWVRAIALSVSGVFGGYMLPRLLPLLSRPVETITDVSEQIASGGVNSELIANAVTDQPLLWYRLLPNPTYGMGILLGLVIAVLPVIIVLIWLVAAKKWQLTVWQKLAVMVPLLAFLVVGLIVSTKIGGGGDLHNMDMFLIGMAFTVFIAWVNGGREAVLSSAMPVWVRLVFAVSLIIPAVYPLWELRSYDFGDEMKTLLVLTDTTNKRHLDMLPDHATVDKTLREIQDFVTYAQERGDVLFIDQRQLLTFDYVRAPLIPEYEKKVLMNEALSSNTDYFPQFYRDLSARRFSLIMTEPLRTPVRDSSYRFGEENNAWVMWVAIPVLCYYEEIRIYKEVNVQLLVPKDVPDDCSEYIPDFPP